MKLSFLHAIALGGMAPIGLAKPLPQDDPALLASLSDSLDDVPSVTRVISPLPLPTDSALPTDDLESVTEAAPMSSVGLPLLATPSSLDTLTITVETTAAPILGTATDVLPPLVTAPSFPPLLPMAPSVSSMLGGPLPTVPADADAPELKGIIQQLFSIIDRLLSLLGVQTPVTPPTEEPPTPEETDTEIPIVSTIEPETLPPADTETEDPWPTTVPWLGGEPYPLVNATSVDLGAAPTGVLSTMPWLLTGTSVPEPVPAETPSTEAPPVETLSVETPSTTEDTPVETTEPSPTDVTLSPPLATAPLFTAPLVSVLSGSAPTPTTLATLASPLPPGTPPLPTNLPPLPTDLPELSPPVATLLRSFLSALDSLLRGILVGRGQAQQQQQ